MPLPQKIAQDETQGHSGLGGLALGMTGAAGAGGAIYSSLEADRQLSANGFLPGGDRGVVRRAILDMIRSNGLSPKSLARYTNASTGFLTGHVAPGVTGLDSLRTIGRSLGVNNPVRRIPLIGRYLAAMLRTRGAELKKWRDMAHFQGFPTVQRGLHTLLLENTNYDDFYLNNVARKIRDALAASKWKPDSAAASALDKSLRALYNNVWAHSTVRMDKELQPILADIVNRTGRRASLRKIREALAPGLGNAKSKTLFDAIEHRIYQPGTADDVVRRVGRIPAGAIANLLTAQHTNYYQKSHSAQLIALGLLKAFRSRGFRAGAGIAGGLSLAGGLYSALRNRKSN